MKFLRLSKMNKLFSMGIVCSLFSVSLYGQQNPANRYVPPSPNSAALAKFVDIPVNIHTGIPQIGVPIHSWKNEVSGLSLNISLNYHAGGVKVEEMASSVGLGWSLNAGGVITRTMRGRPDEASLGFLNTSILPNISTPLYSGGIIPHQAGLGYAINVSNNPTDFQTVLDIEANTLDGAQDVFFYNFNGKSGKFFIGKNGTILVQSLDNLKINPIRLSPFQLNGFEVIDDQGILYIFNAIETTASTIHTYQMQGDGPEQNYANEYISSWYLSEIKSTDRQTSIRFEYDRGLQSYETGFSESKAINYSNNPLAGTPVGYTHQHSRSSNFIGVDAVRLKKIRFPDSTFANFSYGSRTDMTGGYALKQIVMNEGANSFGYQLTQGYLSGRLQLFQLNRFTGLVQENPYVFSYQDGLPERSSTAQDFWGYSGGSGGTLIPKISVGVGFDAFSVGADRNSNAEAVKNGSLWKVVYPTGGCTVYEMECNEAYGEGFFFLNNRTEGPYNIGKTMLNVKYPYDFSDIPVSLAGFVIKFTELSRIVPQPGEPVWWDEADTDMTPVNIVLSNAAETWSTVLFSGTYENLKYMGEIIPSQTVPAPGHYKVEVQMSTAYLYPVEFNIDVYSTFQAGYKNKSVGGLRAKRITNYLDALGTKPASAKAYSYIADNGRSSGKLATEPLNGFYYLTTQVQYDGFNYPVGQVDLFNRSGESTQALGSVQGSPIGYSKVTVQELDGNSTPNGKTIYEFSDLIHRGGSGSYPFLTGEYISWAAALPLKEQTYNASGTLLRMVENNYGITIEEHANENFRSLKTGLVYSSNTSFSNSVKQFAVRQEYPIYGNSLKQWQKESSFENGEVVVSEQNFTYDLLHQAKTITKQTSDGSTRTKLYYPYDFTGLPQFAQLVAENRIANAVKTELWKLNGGTEESLISGEATDFATFGAALRVSATYQVGTEGYTPTAHSPSVLLPPGSYRTAVAFHSYSSKGAPLSLSTLGGSRSSMVWQPNGLSLKALFGNADATELYAADFEANGNTSVAHTGALGHSGSFTPSFVPPNGKSYILSYWRWNGSRWDHVSQAYAPSVAISGTIDDVMVYPSDALPLKSLTYFPLWGVRDILEPAQLQRFEYDGYGRLMSLKDRFGQIVKTYDYHYKP